MCVWKRVKGDSKGSLEVAVLYVRSWMTANKLQLNDNKTEAMIILSNRMSVHSPLPSVIHIRDADVPFVSSVKNLGVTWIQISACLNT